MIHKTTVEELNEFTRNEIIKEVGITLLQSADDYALNSPLEMRLMNSSTNAIANFRTRALKSYDKGEFITDIPCDLQPFIDRESCMYGNERNYHNSRVKYLNQMLDVAAKDPVYLKKCEQTLLNFFMKNMRLAMYSSEKSLSNAWLQTLQMETNLADLYTMLSVKRLGYGNYISGIEDNGRIYSKKIGNLNNSESMLYFDKIHSHAVTFMPLEPAPLQQLIPDNAAWAENRERLEDFTNENNGVMGFHMLETGIENKHFHSSMPHEIRINDKSIKNIVIKDIPPDNIYFRTTYSDDSISIGAMSRPYEGFSLALVSDMFSNLILNNFISTFSAQFLFDLAGCAARDMFICLEKDKYYSTTEVRARSEKMRRQGTLNERVIWLPRFKVNLHGRNMDNDYLTEQVIKLSPSHVSGHPRKCENPNPKQIALAQSVGVVLSTGFTYVREHDRDGSEEFRRVYKSKSAMSLIFGQ
jgi:hypothetical protein